MTENKEHEEEADYGFRIDYRVPVALLLGMLLQFGAGVWWVSSASGQLTRHEQRIDHLEHVLDAGAVADNLIADRLARIEERLIAVQQQQAVNSSRGSVR